LLRVEATDDWPSGIGPGAANGSRGSLYTGGVAGFPLPPLRYYVGSASTSLATAQPGVLSLLLPADGTELGRTVDLSWYEAAGASYYQVEVVDGTSSRLLSAVLPAGVANYRLPPFLTDKAQGLPVRWRVVALGAEGKATAVTAWRTLLPKGAVTP
jgi:hypothetical protein